jgi:hypothetical protein
VTTPLFVVTDRVKHHKFGVGTIVKTEYFSGETDVSRMRDAKLTIAFDKHGCKRVMSYFIESEK